MHWHDFNWHDRGILLNYRVVNYVANSISLYYSSPLEHIYTLKHMRIRTTYIYTYDIYLVIPDDTLERHLNLAPECNMVHSVSLSPQSASSPFPSHWRLVYDVLVYLYLVYNLTIVYSRNIYSQIYIYTYLLSIMIKDFESQMFAYNRI